MLSSGGTEHSTSKLEGEVGLHRGGGLRGVEVETLLECVTGDGLSRRFGLAGSTSRSSTGAEGRVVSDSTNQSHQQSIRYACLRCQKV